MPNSILADFLVKVTEIKAKDICFSQRCKVEKKIKNLHRVTRRGTEDHGVQATCYLCNVIKGIKTILSFLLSLPVLFYKYAISPLFPPVCRHTPSCSQFMLDAIKIHGPFTGLLLGTGRILRCRPGGTHGYDPVPLFRFRKYKPLSGLFNKYKTENRLKR